MDAHRFDSPHAPALRGSSDRVTAVPDITDRAAVRVPLLTVGRGGSATAALIPMTVDHLDPACSSFAGSTR